jgi:osmoprotectant transport system ATP-binding protein
MAHVGDDAADAGARMLAHPESPWLLLLDARDRPLGWVHERRIPVEGRLTAGLAEPTKAILTPWMSLRDALSVMLDEQVITGVAVGSDGRALGVLTVAELAGALR